MLRRCGARCEGTTSKIDATVFGSGSWMLELDHNRHTCDMPDHGRIRAVGVNIPGFLAIGLIMSTGILIDALMSVPVVIGDICISIDCACVIIFFRPRTAACDQGHDWRCHDGTAYYRIITARGIHASEMIARGQLVAPSAHEGVDCLDTGIIARAVLPGRTEVL